MTYHVLILRRTQKELAELPKDIYERVSETIRVLGEDPRPSGCLKLKNREGWRIRVGNYRVLYKIDDEQKTVTVIHVGHRKDIYN